MGWSEYRNGKWTQKQLSDEAVYDDPGVPDSLPDISSYEFIPRIREDSDSTVTDKDVTIFIHRDDLLEQCFLFSGNKLVKKVKDVGQYNNIPDMNFHWVSNQLISLQTKNAEQPDQSALPVSCTDDECIVALEVPPPNDSSQQVTNSFSFYHPFVHKLLGTLSTGTLENLFDFYFTLPVESKIEAELNPNTYGADSSSIYSELKRPYALYNWEIAFHAPMQLVESLLNAQQFEQALKMCHFIFDPPAEARMQN